MLLPLLEMTTFAALIEEVPSVLLTTEVFLKTAA
jgi:hypothetical protein